MVWPSTLYAEPQTSILEIKEKTMANEKTVEDLKKVHPIHKKFEPEWQINSLCYESGEDFIRTVLTRHPRESVSNFNSRVDDGYSFNYGEAIIDLFNFYLFEKPIVRELGPIKKMPQWGLFERDCDLDGTDYDRKMNTGQKLASVTGAIGALVNKYTPAGENITEAQEIEYGIYPYVVFYSLSNVMDWTWGQDPMSGRPRLEYLKLREQDGRYLLLYIGHYELWEIDDRSHQTAMIDRGPMPIDEIPFLWLQNLERLGVKHIGKSDLKGITEIIASIIRNLSCGEEIIKYAGFPMMRKPMLTEEQAAKGANDDVVGHRAVIEFNPELGEDGKPDWLESVVKEPIEAILDWIDRKGDEVYRIKHLSGVHGQRRSNNEVASGLALRYEFQQLNAVLKEKCAYLIEADLGIIRLWLKWQDRLDLFNDVKVIRSDEYAVEDLAVALDNIFTSVEKAHSLTLRKELERKAARLLLPESNEETMRNIDAEVEKLTDEDFNPPVNSMSTSESITTTNTGQD
jgi:hypothetical protein